MDQGIRAAMSWATFAQMQEIGAFLLREAFYHLNEALKYISAGEIFSELIESINPPAGWKGPDVPDSIRAWLAGLDSDAGRSDETTRKLSLAWQEAQRVVGSTPHRLNAKSELSGDHIVGFAINISACLEAVLNGQLLYLREQGALSDGLYSDLDTASIIVKLHMIVSVQQQVRKSSYSHIRKLIKLRNSSVHYKPDSIKIVQLSVEELFGILRDLQKIFATIQGAPKDLLAHSEALRAKWIAPRRPSVPRPIGPSATP